MPQARRKQAYTPSPPLQAFLEGVSRPPSNPEREEFLTKLQLFLGWSSKPQLSPLRYPGGKRRLIRAFLPIIANLGKPVSVFVEPFAGGAAMSLAMLESGLAQRIALSDRDELIGSFWKVVFSHQAYKLADRILDAKVTLGQWESIRASRPKTDLDRAFACFFLNRTSFSGILCPTSGPIGGKAQRSPYKIDCRFNRYALSERILELSRHTPKVLFARTATYRQTMSSVLRSKHAESPGDVLWYFDPPFFEKAVDLYRYCFDDNDHLQMREDLTRLQNFRWILSYDDVERSRQLYSKAPGFYVTTPKYLTAESGSRRETKELIVTNVPRVAVLTDLGIKVRKPKARVYLELKLLPADAADAPSKRMEKRKGKDPKRSKRKTA